jgi:Protein of unknown function (DUF3616)
MTRESVLPNQRLARAARLEFKADSLVHTNLSGAAFTASGTAAAPTHWLWVAGDEACGLDRLQLLPPLNGELLRFGEVQDFPLADVLDLPGGPDDEADLEGLAFADGYLWMAGSHGLKRKNAKADKTGADNAKRLAKTPLDANRRLIACVPVEDDAQGRPQLVRQAADGRRALRLRGDAVDNELTQLLADDPHFRPFMAIPGKDNGFDIEGLAVLGKRLLLGLRGPVLRGWSCILELELDVRVDHLRLAALDNKGTRLRKHFLPLEGLGVRDLAFHGADLFILAGPTMVLNGDIRLFKWMGAAEALGRNTEAVTFEAAPVESIALPHGRSINRAEAICELPAALVEGALAWLVLYDAPGPDRREGDTVVFGDVLRRA